MLKVAGETKVIVTGVGQDQIIEDFWGAHRKEELLQFLTTLNIELFTVPNFSFPLDAPPLHHRYNRARILRLAERGASAGLPLALHEIGSSAGLNLLFDRFHYHYGDTEWGDANSPVRLAPEVLLRASVRV